MEFGLDVSQHQLTWDEVLERVLFAESAGLTGAWVFDHFKALYGDPEGPSLEGWSLLAALAAATRRIRFGTLVSSVTYRHPSVLATQAVTVDHISGGRLDFGIGAGWHEQEHRALGIRFPEPAERIGRLEEAVEIMRLLMTQDGASFQGRYYSLRDATYRPRPVQRPHPPIWIGASGEQLMLPLAASHADVWHTFGSIETLRRKSRLVDEHAERAGRDPRDIRRATNLSLSEPFDEVRARIEALREAGFDYLILSWPREGRSRLERFLSEVLPQVVNG